MRLGRSSQRAGLANGPPTVSPSPASQDAKLDVVSPGGVGGTRPIVVARHEQVAVKVNVWVDAGIAPLVEALNTWTAVVTLDSCESGPDALAFVQFTAEPIERLFTAAEQFALCLSLADVSSAVVAVEWSYGGDVPVGRLTCDPREIRRVADLLVNAARKTPSVDGSSCRAPHSWTVRPSHPALAQ